MPANTMIAVGTHLASQSPLEATMADNSKKPEPIAPEEINPAPWLGRMGEGATLPAGEYISAELRELTERARAHRHRHDTNDKQK
jgi:hypothetical protein